MCILPQFKIEAGGGGGGRKEGRKCQISQSLVTMVRILGFNNFYALSEFL